MKDLTISENIKVFAGRRGMSLSDLARALGKSPQNFIQQVNRDDFRISDLEKIACVLGVKFQYDFVECETSPGAGGPS
jgi:transcriptional regulator with XRE-family HTH domain